MRQRQEADAGIEARDRVKNTGSSMSMHENVPVWYDCCSCEAEPYWVEAFAGNEADLKKAGEEAETS